MLHMILSSLYNESVTGIKKIQGIQDKDLIFYGQSVNTMVMTLLELFSATPMPVL